MFVKAMQKQLMKKHSDHRAVCDRRNANMTTAEVVCLICKQPTVSGRRLEIQGLTYTAKAPVQLMSTAMFPGFTL